ncbi:E3 ubiquitin-protein ligase TRIM7-like isoform X1 [Lethenteron reissneri]|uniref:E3 ubiquitin-protein ligase TRIM7-like isoform X1 n=1 Tax=Lethenteron reissneri TaxID=7753 RepID=UPI002AB5E9B9|nr:E3 ubiquitin-protein ligase TRIM7-like isoform X1 [Lethenteron reissneri]
MASATPSESVDSELCCSICLGKFVCPSTLSCGHSFCLRCLEAAWETASSFSCPQCQATFPVRPQLRKNVALANLAEQLRVGDGMAAAVVCDICTDGQTPAVRTCVKCEMSYCARHARPHLENLRLSDHVLVAPIANLEGRRCRQHRQEQIKFYCEQDESLVCTVCTIAGEHRGHEVIPVENAQQTKQEAFRLEKTGKEEKKTTAESRKQQLKGAYKRVQESLRGTKARISREFERRREQLREEEREALERVDEEGRSVLSRIQADIARYESRVRGLEQEINQLLAALTVQDPLSFLQVFANSLMSHSAVNRRRLCGEEELETLLPKLDRATQRRSSVSQETQDDPDPVSHGLNLAKVISVGGVQTKLLPFLDGRSPTLDTNSAGDRLQISTDLRTATRSAVSQGRPHHPHRFDVWGQALCSESFSSGQHYWEVDMGSAGLCRVGVTYGTIPRRGIAPYAIEGRLGGSDVSWCLEKHGNSFSVLHGGVETSLSVPEPPRRVGVHLDWDAGLLSFYSAHSMAPLHSFHQTFTQPLHPGLWVGGGLFGGKVRDSVRIVDLSGAS